MNIHYLFTGSNALDFIICLRVPMCFCDQKALQLFCTFIVPQQIIKLPLKAVDTCSCVV